MTPRTKGRFILLPMLLCVCLTFCSCGSNESTEKPSAVSSDTAAKDSSPATTAAAGSRDNTPVVLTGSADGTVTYGNDSVTVDASHTEEGYLMVSYSGSNSKVKLQITGSDEITYTYNLHDGYETFPLTSGSGSYTVGVFENIEGTSYSTLFTQAIDVTIQDEFGPYLYANQYVNFSADSKVISKAMELSASANDDLKMSIIILSRILLMIMTKLHLCRAAICLMWMMSLPVRPGSVLITPLSWLPCSGVSGFPPALK